MKDGELPIIPDISLVDRCISMWLRRRQGHFRPCRAWCEIFRDKESGGLLVTLRDDELNLLAVYSEQWGRLRFLSHKTAILAELEWSLLSSRADHG